MEIPTSDAIHQQMAFGEIYDQLSDWICPEKGNCPGYLVICPSIRQYWGRNSRDALAVREFECSGLIQ
jgi:hypothetical protein